MMRWKPWESGIARAARSGSKPLKSVFATDLLSARDNFDFEDRGPLFPGDEEAVLFCVVRDAVQYRFFVDLLPGRQQTAQVDPGDHMPIARVDARNPVRVP